jgi:hypothetical protein
MKKLAILFAILISVSAQAQQVIKSIELDSMIFNEINIYRASLGVAKVKTFDTGELRKVSYVITDLNAGREFFDHTRDTAKLHKGYNSECINSFEMRSTSNPLTDDVLTREELLTLAKITVQAWINSNNHNYLIRSKSVSKSTVTSVIIIKDRSIKLVVSYHDILFN